MKALRKLDGWKHVLLYGSLLAAAAVVFEWFDFRRIALGSTGEVYIVLIAAGFLLLGAFLATRFNAPAPTAPFDGNPQAVVSLGLTRRELDVLEHLAAGHSNQEIADALCVSPNTVKTHVSRVYEKLGAKRRTDAVARARELGITR